jgi:hypothetical protein
MQSTETNIATPMSFVGLSERCVILHANYLLLSKLTSGLSSNLYAPETQMHTSAIITDEREHEMAYLIRHFTEAIGPWYLNLLSFMLVCHC